MCCGVGVGAEEFWDEGEGDVADEVAKMIDVDDVGVDVGIGARCLAHRRCDIERCKVAGSVGVPSSLMAIPRARWAPVGAKMSRP